MEKPEPLNDADFAAEFKSLLEEAYSHIDNRIRPKREANWRRFHGEVKAKPLNGGTDIKVHTIQDSVLTVMPEVLDIFLSADQIVEFLPGTPDVTEGEMCHSANLSVKAQFWDGDSWMACHDAIFEAIVSGYGFWKVYRKQTLHTKVDEEYLTIDEAMVQSKTGAKVQPIWDVNASEDTQQQDENFGKFSITTEKTVDELMIEAIPASAMVWTYSKDFYDASLVAQVTQTRMGELIRMGFTPEELKDVSLSTYQESKINNEENARENNNASTTDKKKFSARSWAATKVTYGEAFAKIDKDGDGIPEMYRVWFAGSGLHVIRYEAAEEHHFIQVPAYRIPHSTYSSGMGDTLEEWQEAETRILRAQIDLSELLAGPMMLNAIGSGVDENKLANWKSFKVIACRSPEAVKWLLPPDVGQSLLGTAQEIKMRREDRAGIARVGSSLRPEDMADVTATVANAAVDSAHKKIAYLARVMAELSVKVMMRRILKVMVEMGTINLYVDGQVIPINTTNYNPNWKIRAKVGLGTGTRLERTATMQQLYQALLPIIEKLGNDNPITDLNKMHNLLYDFGCMQPGVNIGRYLKSSPEAKAAFEALKKQPPPPDPAIIKAQADIKREEAKASATQALKEKQFQFDSQMQQMEAAQDLQLEQQKLAQDFQIDLLKINMEANLEAVAISEQGKTDRAVGNAKIKNPEN